MSINAELTSISLIAPVFKSTLVLSLLIWVAVFLLSFIEKLLQFIEVTNRGEIDIFKPLISVFNPVFCTTNYSNFVEKFFELTKAGMPYKIPKYMENDNTQTVEVPIIIDFKSFIYYDISLFFTS